MTVSIAISAENLHRVIAALEADGHEDLAQLFQKGEENTPEVEEYIAQARDLCCDDLEIDENPTVSISTSGAFVSAWLWVSDGNAA